MEIMPGPTMHRYTAKLRYVHDSLQHLLFWIWCWSPIMTSGTTSFGEDCQSLRVATKIVFYFGTMVLFIAHWPKEMILEDRYFVQIDSSQFVRWLMKTGNSHCMYIIMLELLEGNFILQHIYFPSHSSMRISKCTSNNSLNHRTGADGTHAFPQKLT